MLAVLTGFFTIIGATLAAPALAVTVELNAPAPYDFISLTAAGKHSVVTSLGKRNVGGVRMATGLSWTGTVWYGIWPLNTCIALRDFAGQVLSFRPDEGNECLLMQGRCNGNDEFADLYYNSTNIGDLSEYFWIRNATSYICIEE